ncbi:MAG TPA: hypothetical protein VG798_01390, partial [Rhizomicrobium sp.]|nr:hypothetical protein [Rhizomicrobium sp.]
PPPKFFLPERLEIRRTRSSSIPPEHDRAAKLRPNMVSAMEMNMDEVTLPPGPPGLVQDFVHPMEVVHAKNLSLGQKRALLCFWASDACAVESRPRFRWLPGTPGPILFDHILKALLALDREELGQHPQILPKASPEKRGQPLS